VEVDLVARHEEEERQSELPDGVQGVGGGHPPQHARPDQDAEHDLEHDERDLGDPSHQRGQEGGDDREKRNEDDGGDLRIHGADARGLRVRRAVHTHEIRAG